MSDNKLSSFYDKGFEFLFISPLYTKYKVNLDMQIKNDQEILKEATEDNPPDIVYHDCYYESANFSFIKRLIVTKTELIRYCPICRKEEIIYLVGKEVNKELKDDLIDSHSYMCASEECDFAYEFAEKKWNNRVKSFIETYLDASRNFSVNAVCKQGHKFQSIFHITDNAELIKIGQYPSRMEFETYIKDYNKVLSKINNKELNTAIGLATHGIGAGSFVYLRRVFERVIFDTFNKEFKDEESVTLEEFTLKKMEEKLKLIHEHFDDSINKKMLYEILSKGVHELSDNECKEYFDLLLSALIIILEKQLEKENKKERQEEINKTLNSLHGKLKSK